MFRLQSISRYWVTAKLLPLQHTVVVGVLVDVVGRLDIVIDDNLTALILKDVVSTSVDDGILVLHGDVGDTHSELSGTSLQITQLSGVDVDGVAAVHVIQLHVRQANQSVVGHDSAHLHQLVSIAIAESVDGGVGQVGVVAVDNLDAISQNLELESMVKN